MRKAPRFIAVGLCLLVALSAPALAEKVTEFTVEHPLLQTLCPADANIVLVGSKAIELNPPNKTNNAATDCKVTLKQNNLVILSAACLKKTFVVHYICKKVTHE